MEKYRIQGYIYIALIVLMGLIFGFYNSKEFNIGSMIGSSFGIVCISIAIGSMIVYVFDKIKPKESQFDSTTILDTVEDKKENDLEKARLKILSIFNTIKIGFFASFIIVLIRIFGK